MSHSPALELMLSDASDTSLPAEVPRRIERASITLDHGLLVGELLGVPIGKAQQIIDGVTERSDTDPHFHRDELLTLRVVYSVIYRALGHAIQEDGKPAPNSVGRLLAASDLIITNDDGSLMVEHRRLPLRNLRQDLLTLDAFLTFAIEHDVRIRME